MISDYKDIDMASGHPEVSKARRRIMKARTRSAMDSTTRRLMLEGVIANNSRNYKLAKAGLLAKAETPFT